MRFECPICGPITSSTYSLDNGPYWKKYKREGPWGCPSCKTLLDVKCPNYPRCECVGTRDTFKNNACPRCGAGLLRQVTDHSSAPSNSTAQKTPKTGDTDRRSLAAQLARVAKTDDADRTIWLVAQWLLPGSGYTLRDAVDFYMMGGSFHLEEGDRAQTLRLLHDSSAMSVRAIQHIRASCARGREMIPPPTIPVGPFLAWIYKEVVALEEELRRSAARLRFACPQCGKQLLANDTFAGKKGKCPSCSAVIRIPAPLRLDASGLNAAYGENRGAVASGTDAPNDEGGDGLTMEVARRRLYEGIRNDDRTLIDLGLRGLWRAGERELLSSCDLATHRALIAVANHRFDAAAAEGCVAWGALGSALLCPNPLLRAHAADALAQIGDPATHLVQQLREMLRDAECGQNIAAAKTLAIFGFPEGVGTLLSLAEKGPGVRELAQALDAVFLKRPDVICENDILLWRLAHIPDHRDVDWSQLRKRARDVIAERNRR